MAIISQRRLVWGVNCLLLLTAAMIFRPFRTWIDQVVIARAIHPSLRVQEINLQPISPVAGHSIVQATNVDWASMHGDRCFGIAAEKAWVVIENESLLDKVVSIPKAVLQNSRLYLQTVPASTQLASLHPARTLDSEVDSIWQRYLDAKHGRWQPLELQKHLSDLLSTEAFVGDCRHRITQWIALGAKLAEDAQQLGGNREAADNPFRDPVDVQRSLKRLDELCNQEELRLVEFQSIESEISNKLDQIALLLQEQMEATEEPEDAAVHPDRVDVNKMDLLAWELMEQYGARTLSRIIPFAEVADLLCRGVLSRTTADYDRNYRKENQQILSLENLTASGMFRCDPILAPFSLESRCSITTRNQTESTVQAEFCYQFYCAPYQLRMTVINLPPGCTHNELSIEMMRLDKLRGNIAKTTEPIRLESPQWQIFCNGNEISGHLQFDSRLYSFLSKEILDIPTSKLSSLETESLDGTNTDVQLSFRGDWKTQTWTVSQGQLPQWLIETLESREQQLLRDRESQRLAFVEKYFETQIDRLNNCLSELLDQAMLESRQSSDRMLAVRNVLERKLSEFEKVEFARQPKDEVKR